jgi:hypothetical protein
MPKRKMSQRSASLQKMIEPLYTRPALRHIAWAEDCAFLATLIFGPPCGLNATQRARLSAEDLADLRELWREMRADILVAQAAHAPEKIPWGCRFD